MIKKLLFLVSIFAIPFLVNAQCGPNFPSGSSVGGISNSFGMSFTTSATCEGILTSITSTELDSPNPNATVTVRLYEGDGLAGNVLGELTGVLVSDNAVYDFSALMITMSSSTTYTYIVSKEDVSDTIIGFFEVNAVYPGGNMYWNDAVSNIATPFSVNIDDSTLSINDVDASETKVKVYPNPAANSIQLTSLKQQESYTILDVSGRKVIAGVVNENEAINIQQLNKGIYFIQLEKKVLKFIKY